MRMYYMIKQCWIEFCLLILKFFQVTVIFTMAAIVVVVYYWWLVNLCIKMKTNTQIAAGKPSLLLFISSCLACVSIRVQRKRAAHMQLVQVKFYFLFSNKCLRMYIKLLLLLLLLSLFNKTFANQKSVYGRLWKLCLAVRHTKNVNSQFQYVFWNEL